MRIGRETWTDSVKKDLERAGVNCADDCGVQEEDRNYLKRGEKLFERQKKINFVAWSYSARHEEKASV